MDAVEDVKSRLSIEDVISQYVELKRAGRNFRGLSPFGNEKTPSFMVSPEKQIWHDFSSGKGGNMFSFVMEMEGVDFKGALELLARQAGVDLAQYRGSDYAGRTQQRERLYAANELAAKFYQVQFSHSQDALNYIFKQRRFSKQTALNFQLGYSPNTGHALRDFLVKKGFTLDELKKAGLVTQRYREASDMFRGRIMIPLMDSIGRVIGFTARLLEDEPNAPKYINTPQTLLYDKSRHVFGLHLAKDAIRKSDFAVLVEGNMDVIASHQAEVPQAVATAGTALTEQQLKALGRFTHNVRLAYDQDQAGLTATERSIPIANKVGVALSMVPIKGGKDPDELIQKDPKAWQAAVTQPQYALDWLIERYQDTLDLKSAQGKRQFSDVLMNTISQLSDQVEQDHYISHIAKLLEVVPDALRSKLKSETKPASRRRNALMPMEPDAKTAAEHRKLQDHILALCLLVPELRDYLSPITADMMYTDDARRLLAYLRDQQGVETVELTAPALKDLAEYVNILVLQFEQLYKGLEPLELRYEIARLQARLIEQYVFRQKQTLAEQMRRAGDAETDELLVRAKTLDLLLKKHQGA